MKYIKIFILSFISVLLCGCSKTIIDELPEGYYINLKEEAVDVYSDVNFSDIVSGTNIEYKNNDKLNTNSLGKKSYAIEFEADKNKYIYHVDYEVKDLSKPRILSSGDRYVTVNSDVWLCDYIMYGDEFDKEPVCRVEGDYDLNTLGNYNIKYIVSDEAGNEEYFDTVLHVIEESDDNTSYKDTTTYFSDVIKNNKNDNTLIGIDVSSWQGVVDYERVKESGAEFVFIRIGVELNKDGEVEIDSTYKENIKNAKEAGLKVGVYFYSIALDKDTAEEHAKWVLNTLNKEKLDLPIVFDWESFNNWNSYKMSFHDINEIADTFIKTVEDAGYKGMLYSSKFYLENIWTNKHKYPVWLAHYTNNTNYEGDYYVWQMCNDGIIDGINGDVDIDILYLNK